MEARAHRRWTRSHARVHVVTTAPRAPSTLTSVAIVMRASTELASIQSVRTDARVITVGPVPAVNHVTSHVHHLRASTVALAPPI